MEWRLLLLLRKIALLLQEVMVCITFRATRILALITHQSGVGHLRWYVFVVFDDGSQTNRSLLVSAG